MDLTVDGRRVFAGTGGRPLERDRPLVVLLHGAGMDHTVWVLQARFLAHHGFSVLAVDMPAHGRSEGDPLTTIEAMADWVADAIAATGFPRASLVGHSMGAAVALSAASRAPDRVERLALLGASIAMPVHPALLESSKAGTLLAPELMTFWGLGRTSQVGGHPTPGLWLTGAARRLIQKGVGPALAADLHACAAWKGGPEAAARTKAPTLVFAGAEDRMVPASKSREMAKAIASADIVTIPASGHMMMLEAPDATVNALNRFLGGRQ
ncbi:MAG: alpha/beta hydrolase [Alphaproteobacteria bacterium]|nr:alpha/beta hydrolase [Alphaproteobacteria bacterium]